jgi:putative spermidine/putrescine transport system ATP-binding protein
VESGHTTASGTVTDVVYLGSVNHYLVALDAGPTLTVLRQNLQDSTEQALSRRGQTVTVGWAGEHVIDLSGHPEQAQQPHQKEKS